MLSAVKYQHQNQLRQVAPALPKGADMYPLHISMLNNRGYILSYDKARMAVDFQGNAMVVHWFAGDLRYVGKPIVQELLQFAKSQGASKLYWKSDILNQATTHLYAGIGTLISHDAQFLYWEAS